MPGALVPWKLWDLHPCPISSPLERVPELEPRPESQEDASDGMSSHSMTTRSFALLEDPDVPTKPRVFFLDLDFFFRLSIFFFEVLNYMWLIHFGEHCRPILQVLVHVLVLCIVSGVHLYVGNLSFLKSREEKSSLYNPVTSSVNLAFYTLQCIIPFSHQNVSCNPRPALCPGTK